MCFVTIKTDLRCHLVVQTHAKVGPRTTIEVWRYRRRRAPGVWTRASNCNNSNHNLQTWEASVTYMCIHYFLKFILDFSNKLMCAKGVKSENVSVHAKLYSFGKFDIKLLSRKLHKLIYNYFRFTRRYHAIFISLSAEKGWKNVCMRTWQMSSFAFERN